MRPKEDVEVEIIRLLKEGPDRYLSGEALSSALGVTRTAVWKHIEVLRKSGYSIEAAPSKGYCLDKSAPLPFNGIEISSSLSTEIIGRVARFYPALDSTNLKAFDLARGGAPEGAVVIADEQTSGKGRIGRKWESPAGVNLYTSIILRPEIPPQRAHNLTFLSAVAVAEAVGGVINERPAVKWPNDVLIGSKKAAGILLEMDSEPDRVHFVIIGIGVNINLMVRNLPESIRKTATSLREATGREVDRASVARSLYSSVEKWYKIYLDKGFAPVLKAWRGYFYAEGKTVTISAFKGSVTGVCMGVDDDGALLLRLPTGKLQRIISGDMESAG